MGHDSSHPEFIVDDCSSQVDQDASDEFTAINGFCRILLVGILVLGLFFVASVAYLAVVHAPA